MSSSPTDRHQQIHADLTAALAPLGARVEDLTVTPAGKRRIVRVLVDKDLDSLDLPDDTSVIEPLDLDTVGDLTKAISDTLDATDAMGEQPYVLEVSSPGVDRPLTQPRHYRRNVGRLVTVQRSEGGETTGRLVRAGADDFDLRPEGGKPQAGKAGAASVITLGYDAVTKGKVNVEFNRADPADPADSTDMNDTTDTTKEGQH